MQYEGEYYLTGVMETGCGFKVNDDHTFEFFFSYGALDRHGYGTWKEISDGEIALFTDYGNQTPFTIIAEEKRDFTGIKMGFPNYNKALLSETTIKIFDGANEEEQVAGSQGIFHFTGTKADKIKITCLYYFDNPATLVPADPLHNYFELTANHNLPLVNFKDVRFHADGESLSGILYLLDDKRIFRFVK